MLWHFRRVSRQAPFACAGTINAIDAARKAGVKKLVLMTSLLTNAREAGQGLNPGFIFLNLFGGVLDAKLEVR